MFSRLIRKMMHHLDLLWNGAEAVERNFKEVKLKEVDLPNFNKMTKLEIDEFGDRFNLKLDRRKTKAHMIADLKIKLEKKDLFDPRA